MVKTIRTGLGTGDGKGYKNILHTDSNVHSSSAKGIKTAYLNKMVSQSKFADESTDIPYSDNVNYFLNDVSNKVIYVQKDYLGKGWYNIVVGNEKMKSRNPKNDIDNLMKKYAGFKPISLYAETSYYLSKKESGKITNYGTKPYTLEYSEFSPIKKVEFLNPVKTTSKYNFGKPISKVVLQKWKYAVLNWIPKNDKVKLQVKVSQSNPYGDKKVLYSGKKYDEKNYKDAILEFKSVVDNIKMGKI